MSGMLPLLLLVADEAPEPNDVVAGWTGLWIVLAMMAALAVLGWSLIKHLKKVDRAEDEGRYDASGGADEDDAGPAR